MSGRLILPCLQADLDMKMNGKPLKLTATGMEAGYHHPLNVATKTLMGDYKAKLVKSLRLL